MDEPESDFVAESDQGVGQVTVDQDGHGGVGGGGLDQHPHGVDHHLRPHLPQQGAQAIRSGDIHQMGIREDPGPRGRVQIAAAGFPQVVGEHVPRHAPGAENKNPRPAHDSLRQTVRFT
ncbi:MAG: hypothetical protein U1F77_11965 [Kiritimatiellia bacterium]